MNGGRQARVWARAVRGAGGKEGGEGVEVGVGVEVEKGGGGQSLPQWSRSLSHARCRVHVDVGRQVRASVRVGQGEAEGVEVGEEVGGGGEVGKGRGKRGQHIVHRRECQGYMHGDRQ